MATGEYLSEGREPTAGWVPRNVAARKGAKQVMIFKQASLLRCQHDECNVSNMLGALTKLDGISSIVTTSRNFGWLFFARVPL